MVVLTCARCSRKVKPDEAVHNKDGRVVCPNCADELGIKTEEIQELREVTRMVARGIVEAEREELRTVAHSDGASSVLAAAVVEALDWVLGESRWPPSEKLT